MIQTNKKAFDHMAVKGAVVVQQMVNSTSAGVAFTLDPDTGFRDVVVITGSYGLGESVVGGKVGTLLQPVVTYFDILASP